MNALSIGFKHSCHRVLGQPVDLDVGMDLSQLVSDRQVTASVAKPNR